MCVSAYRSATMLVLCSNVTVSVKKFTCVSVRLEWSLDQLGRHISTVIIIIIIISVFDFFSEHSVVPICLGRSLSM